MIFGLCRKLIKAPDHLLQSVVQFSLCHLISVLTIVFSESRLFPNWSFCFLRIFNILIVKFQEGFAYKGKYSTNISYFKLQIVIRDLSGSIKVSGASCSHIEDACKRRRLEKMPKKICKT